MADQEVLKTTPDHDQQQLQSPPPPQVPVVVVDITTDVPQSDKDIKPPTATNSDQKNPPPPPPIPETEEEEQTMISPTKPSTATADSDSTPNPSSEKMGCSFEEETTKVSDLPDSEKKALEELKQLVRDALLNRGFSSDPPPPTPPPKAEQTNPTPPEVEKEKEEAESESESKSPVSVVAPSVDDIKPLSEHIVDETNRESEKTPPTPNVPELETDKAIEVPTKDTAVDDDGAKTVEAIEETIVAVSVSVPPVKESGPEAEEKPVEAEAEKETAEPPPPEEVYIWGIKLLEDERSDVILQKFLRARDFKVKEAFAMLKNTVRWRKEFGIDGLLLEEDLGGDDLEKVVFMDGFSREGHPVCYNVYGQFRNKELYQKTFSDEGKRQKFLRWRIQFLEKSIRKLDFRPGGISTIVQVNDLKNSPGPGKWELRQATKQALQLLQDNYPEFVAKQVFVNVPWWYLTVNRMISPFLTQRTKSKFVFAGPSKSAETLFKYIAVEQVPVQYGGLSKEGEFGTEDAVTEMTLKPNSKHTVEFPATEACLVSWEIRVVGWDVSYGAEFVPSGGDGYTVIIQKARRVVVGSGEEPVVVRNSFKIGEPGKVVLTIDNTTSKKKRLLYRLKSTKPSSLPEF